MVHSLLKNQAYVNGKWTDASDNKRFNVINPANQKIVGEVPDMSAADAQKAIDAAYETFHSKAWQNTTAKDRSILLRVSFLEESPRKLV
jgi:succinate-semialdehyde dehydrogenase